jgi:hypothetical protein
MREFSQLLYDETNNMVRHENIYSWNDSALFLANTDGNNNITEIMKEVDNLKKKIDRIHRCYAISVKGMSFTEPNFTNGNKFKFNYLKTSSYAFTNCFNIEKEFGKPFKKSWYIDNRIAVEIKTLNKPVIRDLEMLPNNEKRAIHMYDGYLWAK